MINRRIFLGGLVGLGSSLNGRSALAQYRKPNDSSAYLNRMLARGGVVDLIGGPYFVSSDLYVPPTATVRFAGDARLVLDQGTSVVWDGGIEAGPRQHIFDGDLIRGRYQRIGDTPYKFALSGRPSIDWASPFWFGAQGDGKADDTTALYCAQYFGGRQYLPAGQYAVSQSIHLRQSNQLLYGDGPMSMVKASSANLGQVIGLRGSPPIGPDTEPGNYVVGATIRDLSIDGADAVNNNGIGVSFCRQCRIQDVLMQNIGRKGVTLQYWCQQNVVDNIHIVDALQEPGGKTAAVSIEGQRSNLNFSLDGGASRTADMEGWDCVDNSFSRITIIHTSYRYIVLTRARNNIFSDISFGQVPGTRSDIAFGPFTEGNTFYRLRRSGPISVCQPLNSNQLSVTEGGRIAPMKC